MKASFGWERRRHRRNYLSLLRPRLNFWVNLAKALVRIILSNYSPNKTLFYAYLLITYTLLIIVPNASFASTLNCDELVAWEPRAKEAYPADDFGDVFMRDMVGSYDLEEVMEIVKGVEDCEIKMYNGKEHRLFSNILYKLHRQREISSRQRRLDEVIKNWISDLDQWIERVQNLPLDDELSGLYLSQATGHSSAVIDAPEEVRLSPQSRQLRELIDEKWHEFRKASSARRPAADERQLADRVETAVAQYGAAVDDLGFPEAYLQANIVIEGLFENQRWITFREWLAALHLSGHFEKIEGSQLVGLDAYGVTLKQDSTRAYGLYFILQGNDLFLTYAGEVNAVRQIRRNEKFEYGLQLQGLIK